MVGRTAGTAPFTTRLVVHRPTDPTAANGTVIVEWLNVTGGLDVPALWMPTHRHLVRAGYTWVGVSAQQVGIEGGGVMPGLGLRQTAPERYASLVASRRRVLVRHVHAGRPRGADIAARAVRRAGRAGRRDGRVAVGLPPHDLRQRDRSARRGRSTGSCCRDGPAPARRSKAGSRGTSAANDREARRARLVGQDQIRDDARVPGDGRAERDRRVRRARVPPRPSARHRPVPAVGGRGRGALRHVLPCARRRRTPVAAGRASSPALIGRAGRTRGSRPSSDQLRARRCTTCCSARSTRSTTGSRDGNAAAHGRSTRPMTTVRSRSTRSASPAAECARRGSTFRRARSPDSASRAR